MSARHLRSTFVGLVAVTVLSCAMWSVFADTVIANQDPPAKATATASPTPKATKEILPSASKQVAGAADGKMPRAFVESPEHDFGVTWAEAELRHTFKMKNVGEGVLRILKVKPGCGCTKAGKYADEIAPGQEGEFSFKLRTKGLRKYRKSIQVTTNDPITPVVTLALIGQVKHHVDVLPNERVYFRDVIGDSPVTEVVKIVNNTEKPLSLTLPQKKPGSEFVYALEEKVAGKEYELKITMNPPFVPGQVRDALMIDTNLPEQPAVNVRIHARIPERIEVKPIPLMIAESPNESSRLIRVINHDKQPLEVTEVVCSDPKLQEGVRLVARRPGFEYHIQVQVPGSYEFPSGVSQIVIKTTDKEKPEITVPVVDRSTRVKTKAEKVKGKVDQAISSKRAKAHKLPPTQEIEKAKPAPETTPTPKPEDTAAPEKNTAPAKPIKAKRNRPQYEMIGKESPEFSFKTLTGKTITSAELKGKITVLDLVAPNCGWCKKQLPIVDRVGQAYKDNDKVQFWYVTQKMGKPYSEAQVKEWSSDLGLKGDVAIDSGNTLGAALQAKSYPSLFVVGPDGNVDSVFLGALSIQNGELEDKVSELVRRARRQEKVDMLPDISGRGGANIGRVRATVGGRPVKPKISTTPPKRIQRVDPETGEPMEE